MARTLRKSFPTSGLRKKLLNWFPSFLPFVFIVGVTLLFFYPVWLRGALPLPLDALVGAHIPWTEVQWQGYPTGVPIKNLEITDSISQFYPWRALAGEFWRAGKIPLWNPYMFSGTPFLATLHSATLYPLNVAYLFLNNQSAWTLLVILQVFLASLFMYLFLVTLGLKKIPSLLGSTSFSFSGYMIGWLEFGTGGHAGLWLPLLLLLEYKAVNSRKLFFILPIALVFLFIYTAGDFQIPLYISLIYLLFGVFLAAKNGISQHLTQKVSIVFIGISFGILLSSLQLLPTFELYRQSIRVDDSYIREFSFGFMPWQKVTNFLWPDFYGNPATGNNWGKFSYHEYISFIGVISFLFALITLFSKKTSIEKFFWFITIISLLFLFPTPIGLLPYTLHLPGLGTSFASRIIFLVDFSLAVLAAYGLSRWQEEGKKIIKIIVCLLFLTTGVALGLFSLTENPNVPEITHINVALKNMIPSTALLIILGAIVLLGNIFKNSLFQKLLSSFILLIALLELLRFGWKNTTFSSPQLLYPSTDILNFLQQQSSPFRIAGGIPTNLFIPYNIKSVEGYDSLYPVRYAQWISAVNFGHIEFPTRRYGLVTHFSSPLLQHANVRYVVDYKKKNGVISHEGTASKELTTSAYRPIISEGRVVVFENIKALPRVWLSGNYRVIKEPSKIIDGLHAKDAIDKNLIIVEKDPGIEIEKTTVIYEIKKFKESFNEVEIEVSNSDNALLFLSQAFFPGWKAFVDGEEIEVLRANYTFQTISVPKGKHDIKFIYDPRSFKIGISISFTTSVFLIAIILYERVKIARRRVT